VPARRILCIDDNEDTCFLLTTMLGKAGMEAVSAPGLDEALRLVEGGQFDLYVLDGQMPGVSGLTLCERIRAADAHTPIVVFSGQGGEDIKEAARRAGANAYVVKPELTELVETVKRLLLEVPGSVA
jgi:CheY-like chemotaxis protein